MPSRFIFLFFSFVLVLSAGCNDNVIERHHASIDNQQWTYNDILKFDFEILDTIARYDLVAVVDHSDEYPFQNLYTRIHTIQPPADTSIQVVSLELAEHTGQWFGKCSGQSCTVEIVLQKNFRVLTPGLYQIWLEQFMREPVVTGIRGVSLELRSADQEAIQ